MDIVEFQRIKSQFDNGLIPIQNKRRIASFLFNNKWYPVKSFVNQIHPLLNTHESISRLTGLIPYLRFKEVNFIGSNNIPIPLITSETLEETKFLLQRLNDLYTD